MNGSQLEKSGLHFAKFGSRLREALHRVSSKAKAAARVPGGETATRATGVIAPRASATSQPYFEPLSLVGRRSTRVQWARSSALPVKAKLILKLQKGLCGT